MTDLPFGRGGSPLQNLILRGYEQTQLSAIKCVAEIDAGPVYRKTPLSLEGTAEEILDRAAYLICDVIVDIIQNKPVPIPQTGEVLKFHRRSSKDSDISSLQVITQVYDYIRMLDADNYPSAFLETDCLRFEFSEACLGEDYVEAKVRITRLENE
jgi:methionyl-tRNA formyltransferase